MARILVVDDDPPVRALMRAILTIGGHRVTEAPSGEAALEHIGNEPFDIVLLDLMLPQMSGYEVLEKLRDLPGGNALKVVIVSALDDGDQRGIREAMLGALGHLTKPFGSRDLEETVSDALAVGAQEHAERRRRAAAIYQDTFEVARKIR